MFRIVIVTCCCIQIMSKKCRFTDVTVLHCTTLYIALLSKTVTREAARQSIHSLSNTPSYPHYTIKKQLQQANACKHKMTNGKIINKSTHSHSKTTPPPPKKAKFSINSGKVVFVSHSTFLSGWHYEIKTTQYNNKKLL